MSRARSRQSMQLIEGNWLRGVDLNHRPWVMSPRGNGISTTYKTRVATEKPCKECLGSVIGQLKDSRILSIITCQYSSIMELY